MRFSVWPHAHRPWRELLAICRHAEATGWDGIWFGDEAEPALECWAVIAALGTAVTRVRLAALVDLDRARHPAVVAKLATTADHLSGGRVVLGLAAGEQPDGTARINEACQVVKGLVGTDRTTLRGRFYRLHDAPLDPKPLQRPFPLLILDNGNTTAEIAARHATHWSVTGSPEAVGRQIDGMRRRCQDIGRDPADLAISVPAADGQLEATTQLRRLLERYRQVGVEEWVLPDQGLARDTLDRIINEVAPALR